MSKRPPKIFDAILRWTVSPKDSEALAGDYEEIYARIAEESPIGAAFLWYAGQLGKLIPIHMMISIIWSLVMFKNYFKIAFRNLYRQKMYSFLNIAGLALGMAATIIIVLYVRGELSYDKHNVNHDRIYRLERMWYSQDGSEKSGFGTLAPSFSMFLEKDFPEFERIVRLYFSNDQLIEIDDRRFTEQNVFIVEEDIFDVFTIPMIKGDPKTALVNPGSVVLSESTVLKYFGKENPIGKSIVTEGTPFKVTGVIEDTPFHAHAHFDLLFSYSSFNTMFGERGKAYFLGDNNFSDNVTFTYALLKPGTNVDLLQSKIPDFLDKYLGTREDDDGNVRKASESTTINFDKLSDIHLYSNTRSEIEANGNATYINTFMIVAVFILLIACVNFMNLSTARAAKRAKEVGLRKVVGANRKTLVSQFLGESLLLSFISLILSLGIIYLLLPYFNAFLNVKMELNLFSNTSDLLMLLVVFLTTGIIAGLYPAFYLSAFDPATILRGEITKGKRAAFFRRSLVVVQFAISIGLIASVGVVRDQISYLYNVDLGYNKENVVLMPLNGELGTKWNEFQNNLLRNENIINASVSKRVPSAQLRDSPGFQIMLGEEWQYSPISSPHNRVGHTFFKTFGMEFVAGRDFDPTIASDSNEAFIFNETAVKKLGFDNPQDALGLRIKLGGYDGRKNGVVIGVVKDFHYESLHHEIPGILTYIDYQAANTIAVRIAGKDIQETLDFISKTVNIYNPGSTPNFEFLDERLASLYKNEDDMLTMFGYFSLFAIVIACLGLFGLASYTAEQKTKEIGIRKVHGASILSVTGKLTKQFVIWVLISSFIALPIAYQLMADWLDDFTYRSQLKISTLMVSVIIAILIAVITVSFQTIKAAKSNPVNALRHE